MIFLRAFAIRRLRAWPIATVLALSMVFMQAGRNIHAEAPPPISLTLAVPQNGTEGATLAGAGKVTLSATSMTPVTVYLLSDNPNRAQVNSTVVIPAGTNSARFDLVLPDNDLIDGPQTIVIEAWIDDDTGDLDIIRVNDDESLLLSVTLPAQVTEGQGTLTNAGTISFHGKPTTNVVIALQSDHAALVAMPSFVTNLTGQTSVSFNLVIGNDALTNGFDFVQIRANAPGFIGASNTLILLDDERSFAPSNPAPANFAVQVPSSTTLSWAIDPRAPVGTIYDVYLGLNPAPGVTEFLGNTKSNVWTLPLLAPNTTYYWQVIGRNVGTMPGSVWRFTTRGVDHFEFTPGGPQLVNEPFLVTVIARDELDRAVTNFTGAVALSASAMSLVASNTILPSPIHDNSASGPATLGYAFTPNANMQVTAVRHYFGTKVSIWTDAGTLLAAQAVSGSEGAWSETPLATPVQLMAGTRYRIGSYH